MTTGPRTCWTLAVLSAALACPLAAQAAPDSVAAPGWQVEKRASLFRYGVRGTADAGHQLALVKRAPDCPADMLWIEWTSRRSLAAFLDRPARVEVEVEGITAQADVQVRFRRQTPAGDVVVLTSPLASPALLSLLAGGAEVLVRVVGPPALLDSLDVYSDTFPLRRYTESRNAAMAACATGR